MEKIGVRFCTSNLVNGSLSSRNRLKNIRPPSVRIREESCLGFCAACVKGAFALVEGKRVEAKTPDELYDEIVRHLSVRLSESASRKEGSGSDRSAQE